MAARIPDDARVLFQGDSITDAGRNYSDPKSVGFGYAMIASSWFNALYPERRVKFFNRGVGGDRVKDLLQRWDADFLAVQPNWVSILVGINNTWRAFDSNDPTDPATFEKHYRRLIRWINEQLQARIVLCDPFLLPVTTEQETLWRPDLDQKIAIVQQLAQEFNAIHVPLDSIFAEASVRRGPKFWLPDGVHPSNAGAALIAQSWLTAVGVI